MQWFIDHSYTNNVYIQRHRMVAEQHKDTATQTRWRQYSQMNGGMHPER